MYERMRFVTRQFHVAVISLNQYVILRQDVCTITDLGARGGGVETP